MSSICDSNIFALVPVEVLADRRLTLEQIRVLIALMSFRNKATDVVWPGRNALAERCGGMHPANVSKATSALAVLGWLVKESSAKGMRYRISIPEVADSATSEKVADSATESVEKVAESATSQVADSATPYIEHTTEHTKKGNRACAGTREAGGENPGSAKQKQESPRELLARYGVPDDTAKSWMRVRKAKRKEITPQALDAIQREAEKLGITLNEALAICCEQSWAGFRATWQEAQEAAAAIRPTAEAGGGAPSAEKPSAGVDWWSSPEGVLKRGSELGIAPNRGESAAEFKRRVQDKHREAQEESARGVSSFLRRRQQGDSRREAA